MGVAVKMGAKGAKMGKTDKGGKERACLCDWPEEIGAREERARSLAGRRESNEGWYDRSTRV